MNLEQLTALAELSRKDIKTGDEYADRRHSWVYDPANRNEAMWWGTPQPYYVFLYHVAKVFSGGVALEIGTHKGIGFAHLAAGAKASGDPKSWTIGIDKDNYSEAQEVAKVYKNCKFLNGLSNDPVIMDQVQAVCTTNKIDIKILFIDATHTFDWVYEEIKAYRSMFADEIVMIFDDIIRADNNTKLPECFESLPGQKLLFPGLHVDNAIGVSLCNKSEFSSWGLPQRNLSV